jgi:hypothetical protein
MAQAESLYKSAPQDAWGSTGGMPVSIPRTIHRAWARGCALAHVRTPLLSKRSMQTEFVRICDFARFFLSRAVSPFVPHKTRTHTHTLCFPGHQVVAGTARAAMHSKGMFSGADA